MPDNAADDIFASAFHAASGFTALFEDDGRVAYAYLLRDNKIVADVWVYNRCDAPAEPEWTQPPTRPFANPHAYASPERIDPASRPDDIAFKWFHDGQGSLEHVDVHLRNQLMARLTTDSKPGWATLATRNGPLARVLRMST